MIKITIQHGGLLEPFLNFYVQNSPDVKGSGWKEWVPPNKEKLDERIEAYKNIWAKYEEKILNKICSALDLSFKENINVYIVAGINRSMSNPMIISSHHSPNEFIITLAHELSHQIFKGEDFKFSKILLNKTDNKKINNHILVFAVLRKVFEDEPEILQTMINTKYSEDYKKAFEASENFEEILKFFRENK
ncbi:MAG: hypothetical protein WC657_04545 [Candidatus Paceibacterota bacterium]|jgi:hypothetical protein